MALNSVISFLNCDTFVTIHGFNFGVDAATCQLEHLIFVIMSLSHKSQHFNLCISSCYLRVVVCTLRACVSKPIL